MVVVAIIGFACGGTISFLRRPYPTGKFLAPTYDGMGSSSGPDRRFDLYQSWSDGWLIRVDKAHPGVKTDAKYGRLLRVEWSDGSISWYWPGPYVYHKYEKWWDGKQTWHNTWGDGPLGSGGRISGPFPDEHPPH